MSEASKGSLLRKLTSKGSSRRHGHSSESNAKEGSLDAPVTIPLSNVNAPKTTVSPDVSVKPLTVQLQAQEVPLSTISIGLAVVVVFLIVWRAILAFSASLLRLAVLIIVAGGVFLFAQAANPKGVTSASPLGLGSTSAIQVDDSAMNTLNEYRRQLERQSSIR